MIYIDNVMTKPQSTDLIIPGIDNTTRNRQLARVIEQSDTRPAGRQAKIDKGKILEYYYIKGHNRADIAKLCGCSLSYVSIVLKPFDRLINSQPAGTITNYRINRVNVLEIAEFILLREMLEPERLRKAPLNHVTEAFRRMFDARRLEQGLSTSNIAIDIQHHYEEAEAKAKIRRNKHK